VAATIIACAGGQAVTARLNALENDNTAAEEVAAASDDEFDVDEESEEERSSDEEDARLGRALSPCVTARLPPARFERLGRAEHSC